MELCSPNQTFPSRPVVRACTLEPAEIGNAGSTVPDVVMRPIESVTCVKAPVRSSKQPPSRENQRLLSGPAVMPPLTPTPHGFRVGSGFGIAKNAVAKVVGSIRPISVEAPSANQRFPSLPAVIRNGKECAGGGGGGHGRIVDWGGGGLRANSVITPAGVTPSTAFLEGSVNHTFPSVP